MSVCFSARSKMSGLFNIGQAQQAEKDTYLPSIQHCFANQQLLNGFAFVVQSLGELGANINLLIQPEADVELIQKARMVALSEFNVAKFTVTECPAEWFSPTTAE